MANRRELKKNIDNMYSCIDEVVRFARQLPFDQQRSNIAGRLERILWLVKNSTEYKACMEALNDAGYQEYNTILTRLLNKLLFGSRGFTMEGGHYPVLPGITVQSPAFRANGPVTPAPETGNDGPGTFSVPDNFYDRFTVESMKEYWPKSKNDTKCSTFLPYLIKMLGQDVYDDIFLHGEQRAHELKDTFKNNQNLLQLAGEGATDLEKAENVAEQAQQLANAGHLVITALDTDSDGHVSVVGPQSLTYKTFPATAWEGHAGAGPSQSGNGYGVVLVNYPVFVQAGSYTGVVTPGYAQGRSNLNKNKVLYFLYRPIKS